MNDYDARIMPEFNRVWPKVKICVTALGKEVRDPCQAAAAGLVR